MKELYTSLAKFNQEVSSISKDASNPMFRNNYATIDQIIAEIRPILAKHGLSIIQIPMNLNLNGGGEWVGVKTILLHESGQTLESEPFYLKAQGQKTANGYAITPQALGSTITYCRRYSLCSLLCLNTGEFDKDDDGNAGSGHNSSNKNSTETAKKTDTEVRKPTDKQLKRYDYLLAESSYEEKALLASYSKRVNREVTRNNMNLDDYNTITKYLQTDVDAKLQGGK